MREEPFHQLPQLRHQPQHREDKKRNQTDKRRRKPHPHPRQIHLLQERNPLHHRRRITLHRLELNANRQKHQRENIRNHRRRQHRNAEPCPHQPHLANHRKHNTNRVRCKERRIHPRTQRLTPIKEPIDKITRRRRQGKRQHRQRRHRPFLINQHLEIRLRPSQRHQEDQPQKAQRIHDDMQHLPIHI